MKAMVDKSVKVLKNTDLNLIKDSYLTKSFDRVFRKIYKEISSYSIIVHILM